MKEKLIKTETPETEEGFSMLEVLVAGLVIFFFLLGSLQAVVLATMLRVQAQTKANAMNFINQEIDSIKYQAFLLNRTNDPNNPYPANSADCNNNYGQKLRSTLATLALPPTITLMENKSYPITRQYAPNNKTLRITWTVDRDGDLYTEDDIIANVTTEVLPDGALYCN